MYHKDFNSAFKKQVNIVCWVWVWENKPWWCHEGWDFTESLCYKLQVWGLNLGGRKGLMKDPTELH